MSKETETTLRERLARVQAMLDQLDRDTQRLRDLAARERRERKMVHRCRA
jgi:hypothetical protein